jgi:hypothetical protein
MLGVKYICNRGSFIDFDVNQNLIVAEITNENETDYYYRYNNGKVIGQWFISKLRFNELVDSGEIIILKVEV